MMGPIAAPHLEAPPLGDPLENMTASRTGTVNGHWLDGHLLYDRGRALSLKYSPPPLFAAFSKGIVVAPPFGDCSSMKKVQCRAEAHVVMEGNKVHIPLLCQELKGALECFSGPQSLGLGSGRDNLQIRVSSSRR